MNSWKDDLDIPPTFIHESKVLNKILNKLSPKFGIFEKVSSDGGHAMASEVTNLLPDIMEF